MKLNGHHPNNRNAISLSMMCAVLGVLIIPVMMASAPPPDKKGKPGGSGHSAGPPATPVLVDGVRMESVQRLRRVTGEIRARRRSIVASQESGLVLDLPYEPGDFVKQGMVVARLDSGLLELQIAELQARREESEATVAEQESELAQARRDLQSLIDLQEEGAAKPKELDDAGTTVRTAEARLRGARRASAYVAAQEASIELRLEHKTILAPFDGVIVAKQTEVGQWVDEGGAIVEMIESRLVDAVLDVPEDYINLIHPSLTVEIALAAFTKPLRGHVRTVVPMGDSRAHTYPVKVELNDMDGKVKPFMTVEAWVPTGVMEKALTIRKDAVLLNETGSFVYVMRDGHAAITPVRPAFSAGMNRVVVLGGLRPSDQIIYEGNERLYPGAPVRVAIMDDEKDARETDAGDDVTSTDHPAEKQEIQGTDHE